MSRMCRIPCTLGLALVLLEGCGDDMTEPLPAEPELVYVHAPGIRLTRLTLNQAVQVELVDGDDVREADSYAVPLVAGRAMLVRAHYSVHTDFAPRELLAQLTVHYPKGSADDGSGGRRDPVIQDSRVMIDSDSIEGSLHHTFAWYLDPQLVIDGLRVRVDVYEPQSYEPGTEPDPDPNASGAGLLDAPALPWAQWDAPLVADPDPMQMQVRLVPIEHHFDNCVSDASVSTEATEAMRKELEQNNPVQGVTISVRDPVQWTDTIGDSESGFSPILTMLSMLRDDDGAPPYEYYYGLITSCDGYPTGLLGQAIGIPEEIDPGLGYLRVAAGRFRGDGQAASETFVHEVGHSQGRKHVRCAGEAGIDLNYPHVGGITGVWGFGIYDLGLRSPAGSRDYMTYCANEWVSDYGYNAVWPVIEALTQWALEDQAGNAPGGASGEFDEILVGALYPDGNMDWWTTHGSVSGFLSPQVGVNWSLSGEQLRLPVWISDRGDDETLNFAAPLPAGALEGAVFSLDLADPDIEGIELVNPNAAISFDTLHRAQ